MRKRLTNIFHKFCKNQQGGVTVDWIFLTAAIISLSAVIMVTIGNGEAEISKNIVTSIASSQDAFAQE